MEQEKQEIEIAKINTEDDLFAGGIKRSNS